MPDEREPDHQQTRENEPRGFGEHARGLAGEYAHEQGWGLNEEERRAQPNQRQPDDGGNDYDYGARDFGDIPADTSQSPPAEPAQSNASSSTQATQEHQQQKGA